MTETAPQASQQKLTPSARRYILIDQGVMAFLVTFAINYGVAWSVFKQMSSVPLNGEKSIIADVSATCFLLPFISCMIVTYLTRMEIQRERFPSLTPFKFSRHLGEYLSQMAFPRSMVFGVLGRLTLGPLLTSAILAWGVDELSVSKFLMAKSLFAATFAAIVCPFFCWFAMHDEPRVPRQGIRSIR